jgi:predicted O-methyltransferase YrrM
MFKRFRSSLKLRKRQKELAQKLAGLEQRFPGFDWKPFQEVTRFFSDKSMSALEEQAFLYRLASQIPPDATVIEIGSWIGHSTCIIGVALRGANARCYAIDAFTGATTIPREVSYYKNFLAKVSSTLSQRELFDRHVARFNLQDKVVAIAADSAQAAALLPPGLPAADLLFIDGGHALDVVRKDIELYVPLVKSGGVVVFHDFSSECGVPTAVWEEIQRGVFGELIGIYATLLAFRKAEQSRS